MAFSLPSLANDINIVGRTGVASRYFSGLWAKLTGEIVKQETRQDTLLAQIMGVKLDTEAALSQASTAAAIANSAGENVPSGGETGKVFDVISSAFVPVSSVALTGITAGTLRFDTTNIYTSQASQIVGNQIFLGSYRILERLTSGGASNVLFLGTWTGERETDPSLPQLVESFIDNKAALDAARPAVGLIGNVTYTLEVARASGTNTATNMFADFRVAKAS